MDPLTRIGIEMGTDKAYYHTFTKFYEPYFRPLRDKEITILEIGIFDGGSLRMLQSYFPRAHIYAIDINPHSVKNYGERISTYLCSQTDTSRLDSLFQDKMFDIILDDGSHVCSHQQISLATLFRRVKPGGMYICEDIHTSFLEGYKDTTPTTYELIASGSFASIHIPHETQVFLNETIAKIELYGRTTLPYSCWNCKQYHHLCKCSLDHSPKQTDSQTSILIRRT